MFPYRRHGAKKRGKGGPGGPGRKPRGAPRTLPNSVRELLPLLQPATKALAQMLAGRTGVGGQLDHARNILAHAERLVAEGAHNRLPPADREELFEQLARLRLTLADADAEAEVHATEEQAPERSAPPPVDQERLREMALALTTRRTEPYRAGAAPQAPAAEQPLDAPIGAADAAAEPGDDGASEPTAEPTAEAPRPLKPLSELPGRLVLSKPGGEAARRAVRAAAPAPEAPGRAVPPQGDGIAATQAVGTAEGTSAEAEAQVPQPDGVETAPDPTPVDGNGAAEQPEADRNAAKPVRRRRKTATGLPEGWVIDEDGYVVPGPG